MATGLPGLTGVDHFGFTVPDLDEARSFLVDVLGCELMYSLGAFERDGAWMAEHLAIPARAIQPDRPFADFGFTSLAVVQLVERLGEALGRAVAPTIPWHYSTPRALARHLMPCTTLDAPGTLGSLAGEIARLSEAQAEVLLLAELDALPKMHV